MIRRLNKEHIDYALYIVDKYKEKELNKEETLKYLEDTNNYTLVYEEETIVGYLNGYVMSRLDGLKMGYIHEVHVDLDKRQKGIGTKLIDAFYQLVCDDVYKIFLITNDSNKPACLLYEKNGYKTIQDDDVIYERMCD